MLTRGETESGDRRSAHPGNAEPSPSEGEAPLPEPPDLTTTTIGGIRWSAASQIVKLFVRTGTLIALSHLLTTQDFGLFATALVVVTFVDLFREMGAADAIVHLRRIDQAVLSTGFWFVNLVGLAAAATIFFLAPAIAEFYSAPDLTNVLRVLSCTLVLASLGMVHKALLIRRLGFRTLAMTETASAVVGAAAALAAAWAGWGVYCLAVQLIVGYGVNTGAYWLSYRWTPELLFFRSEFERLRSFSLDLLAFNVVNYLGRNVGYLLIGRFVGIAELGLYALAYSLLILPLQLISYSVEKVSFAAFTKVRDDQARIARGFLRATQAIAVVTFPLMTGLMVLSDIFIDAVFGAEWAGTAPLLLAFGPLGILQSFGPMCGSIFKSQGRTDLQFRMGALTAIAALISFFCGLPWGIVGVAVAHTIAIFLVSYWVISVPLRLVGLRMRDLLRALARTTACAATMAAVLVGAKVAGFGYAWPSLAQLLVLTMVGCFAYLGSSILINRTQLSQALHAILGRGVVQ